MTRTLEISAIKVETMMTEKITPTPKVVAILLTSTRWVRITKTKDMNIKTVDMMTTTMDRQAIVISGATTMITTSVA
jgi:hypothetical protein